MSLIFVWVAKLQINPEMGRPTSILPFLLLLGLFLGPCQTFGQGQCEDHLSTPKLSYTEKVDRLLEETEAEYLAIFLKKFIIEKGWHGKEKLPKEAIEEIFEEYLRLRLRNFDPSFQAHIYSMARDHIQIIETTEFEVGGSVKPASQKIEISLPEMLVGTVMDYYIRVHELEHVIQGLAVGLKAATPYDPRYASYRFHLEKGAMRAEGAFLKAFPTPFLKEQLSDILHVHAPESLTKDFLENVLANAIAAPTVSDYLQKNWEQGRYSRSKLIQKNLISCALFPGGISLLLLVNLLLGG